MPVVEEAIVEEAAGSKLEASAEAKPKHRHDVECRRQAHFMLPESFITQLQAAVDDEYGGNVTKALVATIEKALKFKKWQKPEMEKDAGVAGRKSRKVGAAPVA